MQKYFVTLIAVAILGAATTAQTRKTTKTQKSPLPLSAREIAKKALEVVVLLVTEDANGKAMTLGSGFQVGPGIIATNYHVIRDASRAYASFHGGNPKFEILGTLAIDEENDLALLRLGRVVAQEDPYDEVVAIAVALPLATVRSAEIGDTVYAVGNPEGLEGTFSQGIISALRGNDYIQITAPISPGSSGGPVLNKYGEVIGIATSTFGEGQNLNFAIPVSKLRRLMVRPSVVTPLAPKVGLRFDGLYWATGLTKLGSEIIKYFRFYPDGSVLSVSTAPEKSPKDIFAWLRPGGTHTGAGRYLVKGSEIEFSTNIGEGTRADHRGTIDRNSLRLHSYFYYSGTDQTEEYRFVKVIQREP